MKKEYSLRQLCERTGISPRNIRFYISKQLLEGPVQAGRNAIYTEDHVSRLLEIIALKQKGLSLHEIAVESHKSARTMAEPTAWIEYSLEDDVRISIRADVSPWRMRQIRRSLNTLLSLIEKNGEER